MMRGCCYTVLYWRTYISTYIHTCTAATGHFSATWLTRTTTLRISLNDSGRIWAVLQFLSVSRSIPFRSSDTSSDFNVFFAKSHVLNPKELKYNLGYLDWMCAWTNVLSGMEVKEGGGVVNATRQIVDTVSHRQITATVLQEKAASSLCAFDEHTTAAGLSGMSPSSEAASTVCLPAVTPVLEQWHRASTRPRKPVLTPSLPQPVKFPGWMIRGCACKRYYFPVL